MDDELLTPAELSAWLKISAATIKQWRHRGVGPHGFVLGRRVRYRRSVVEKWLRDQEQAERAGAA